MIQRVQDSLSPRVPPEQRPAWARLARTVVYGLLGLLGFTILASLALAWLSPGTDPRQLIFHFGAAVALMIVALQALQWIRRGRILASGYAIATALLLVGVTSLIINPEHILFSTAAFGLSILIVGALVGGASVYPYAVLSSLGALASWVLTSGSFPLLDNFSGRSFLVGQITLYIGSAFALHMLTNYIQQTVSTLQHQTDRLAQLAHTDPLTNLANRRHYLEQLQMEFSRARRYRRPLSMLYLDLDGFKGINDRFGHMFGDEVLRGAARSMRAVLRSTDLLARIGGDEFAVLLPETTLDGAEEVSNKLAKALLAYGRQAGPGIPPLTFCGGLARLRPDDRSIDDLLARADDAQYMAKATGKAHTRTEAELEEVEETKPTQMRP